MADEGYHSSIVSLRWEESGGKLQDLFLTCSSSENEMPYESGLWELYTKNGESIGLAAKREDQMLLITMLS